MKFHRRIHADRRKFFAHHRHIKVFPQRFSGALLFDLIHMGIGSLNITICSNQRRRPFFTDSRNARNIVGGIPHQRFQFNDLRRSHLIYGFYICRMIILDLRDALPGLRHPDQDPVRGDLQKIPVSRHNNRIQPFCLALSRHRPKQVIRLIALLHQKRNSHGGNQFLQNGNLLPKFIRHPFSRPFIGLIHLMPERRRTQVKCHHQIIRFFLIQDPEHNIQKAIDSIRMKPFCIRQIRHSVKCPVYYAVAVNQHHFSTH